MKKEINQIANLFKTEIRFASSLISAMRRRNVLIVGFFTLALFASKGIVEAHLSLSSLPFLRGGYTAFAPVTKPLETQRISPPSPILFRLDNLQRTINNIGDKIQAETTKLWSDLHENFGREWGKFTSSLGKLISREQAEGSKKLDEVLRAFKSVLTGSEVDTAQLLKACRAHLILMKSGGSALKVVAKDMETNLNKAESLFKKLPKEGKYLSSLLEKEREIGIHDGNMLKDASAAMGLLWIRRSLSFQLDLYASLIPSDGQHPKDAAMDAYYKTLSPYHGWLLQKAFPLSFSQMPDRKVFIAKFGGRELENLDADYEHEIVKKLKSLVAIWEPIIKTWSDEFERLDLEDKRRA
mmetsp:Transcript_32792/g.55782  ORF Transcript_32792/g.55782 Transcript_32792/m.55782 type:complete len:354 (-) Transcript_32792:116-1177(-)|eukprot:CAMPEP_0183731518 /NCGR_PEP_ID=MMETSP0737-20130205/35641_1 /TAXON_ID=385413 /ORGANISM="Thalassiosira miniscula, Strain CCMP1093" /LENGTH=353 /DNA_ID=CAMNT_0025964265 /DNA_START=308 /DNA_END=1369 /DNA_ORIENTATION=+